MSRGRLYTTKAKAISLSPILNPHEPMTQSVSRLAKPVLRITKRRKYITGVIELKGDCPTRVFDKETSKKLKDRADKAQRA